MIGVVYDPVNAVLYDATAGEGVRRNGRAFCAPDNTLERSAHALKVFCDCSFELHPQRAEIEAGVRRLTKKLGYGSVLIRMGGGAVMNACSVFEKPPACYFKQPKMKADGGSIWDFAATACLFAELNRSVTDFHITRGKMNA